MAVDTQDKTARDAMGSSTSKARSFTDGSESRCRHGAAIGTASPGTDMDSAEKTASKQDVVGTVAVDSDDATARLCIRLAALIETVEVQAAMVALIAFDVVSTIVSRLVRSHYEILRLDALVRASSLKKSTPYSAAPQPPAVAVSVLLRLLDSLAGFAIIVFAIELAVLVFTFRRRFFQHFGYAIDLVVVGVSISLEIYTESNVIRMLGVFRVWRVFRLVETLLEREKKRHEIAMDALELEKSRVFQLQYEKQAAEQSLQREIASRAGIERMLRGYKDEADTLREALTIAAQAVAEATMQVTTSSLEEPSGFDIGGIEGSYQDWEYGAAYTDDSTRIPYASGHEGEDEQASTQAHWETGIEQSMPIDEPEVDAASHVVRADEVDSEDDDDVGFADAQADDG